MIWNINQDKLTFKPVKKSYPNTKRGILLLVTWVIGLLGVLTPSLLQPKLIIQEPWKLKNSWGGQSPMELEAR